MAYIIRRLGEQGYGQWSAATAIVGVSSVVTGLGLRPRFVRDLAQRPASASELLAEQVGLRSLLALLAGAAGLLVCIGLRYSPTIMACVAIGSLGLLLSAVVTTVADVLQASERLPVLSAVNFAAGLGLTIASVLVVWGGGGPVAVAAAYLAGPLIAMFALVSIIRREGIRVRASVSAARAARMLWNCRHFGFQQMLSAVNLNAASLMLPKLVGVRQFALFSAGNIISDRMTVVPDAIGTALYPFVAIGAAHSLRSAVRRAVSGICFAAVAGLVIAIAGWSVSSVVAHILFPKQPGGCEAVIRLTVWAIPLLGVEYAMGYTLLAIGREASQARATLVGVAGGLLLGLILIPRWGLPGACWFIVLRPAIQICCRIPDYVAFLRAGSGEVPSGPEDPRIVPNEFAVSTLVPESAASPA